MSRRLTDGPVRCYSRSVSRSVVHEPERFLDRAAMRCGLEPSGQFFPLGKNAIGHRLVEVVETELENQATWRHDDPELE
jgi:hypothetical protein